MFDDIYKDMTRGGIPSKLSKVFTLTKQGEIVETKEESFGLPTST
jgi:hypothetical protein